VIDELAARALVRTGEERIGAHLADTYGIEVAGTSELDRGVHRIDRRDGAAWVARLFPAARPAARAYEDAAILAGLHEAGFPAERPATAQPVSELEGQAVLVTEWVPSVPRAERRDAIRAGGGLAALGALLGKLATLPASEGAFARPGGAWHHLSDGSPADELATARAMLDEVARMAPAAGRARIERIAASLDAADAGGGLPEAFVHADLALANVVAPPTGRLVVVDWAGAGRAPRAWALAFLLWASAGDDPRRIDRVVKGYRSRVEPDPDELERLAALIRARPIVFDAWAFCVGRRSLEDVTRAVPASVRRAAEIAERARAAFAAPD
jgi:Ser/Thr protein kinase RdoA (MazF antagonist)